MERFSYRVEPDSSDQIQEIAAIGKDKKDE
jgi:hypothetical protein